MVHRFGLSAPNGLRLLTLPDRCLTCRDCLLSVCWLLKLSIKKIFNSQVLTSPLKTLQTHWV